jgi:cytochrome c oxidase subunit 2
MTYLIGFLIIALLAVIAIQIGKVSDLAAEVRGVEEVEEQENNRTGVLLVLFMIGFLIFCIVSAWYYRNDMLGYGPWESSSEHGKDLDYLFNITLVFTGIVFVITHILLFWYAYKYRKQEGRKAVFLVHDTKLELIWTAIPAIVMAYLVANGLVIWNKVMPDVDPNQSYLEIEAIGYQFAWDLRHPGEDGKLGTRDFAIAQDKDYSFASNPLYIDWSDKKSHDDIVLSGSDNLVLPVDTLVRVRITSKDVLHNFYLPHFRVKMDAVPGLPTYFIFKPTKTTAQMRQELRAYPEWNVPADPDEPDGPKRWEEFQYELACAELCGTGHYSMKRIVEIVEQDQYDEWKASKNATYPSTVRGKDFDPLKDNLLLDFEISARESELDAVAANTWEKFANGGEEVRSAIPVEDLTLRLKNVFFETGSANLNVASYNEIDYIAKLLKNYPSLSLEVGGHTDNTGDPEANRTLSLDRAQAVYSRLMEAGIAESQLTLTGYGQSSPIDTNDTTEGRANNRRTELKVISK